MRQFALAFAALLGASACSPPPPLTPPSQTAMTPEESKRLLAESMAALSPELRQAFQDGEQRAREEEARRPRVTSLNDDAWRAIPDGQLDEAVMAYINGRVYGQSGQNGDPTPLAALPLGFQIFHVAFIVEAEVANGGFNQFFWNSSGEYATQVPGALRALGADDAAALFEQVRTVADQDRPRLTAFKARGSLQAFSESYKDSPLNAYDESFMDLAMEFPALRIEYLKRHIEQFRD